MKLHYSEHWKEEWKSDMDKQEIVELMHEIRDAYEDGNYDSAVFYAEELDISRVKDNRLLEMISDAYVQLGRYDEAKDTLLVAYERMPNSKQLAYKLCMLSVETGNLDDAVEFYEDFCQIAPRDNRRYLLKYIIGKEGGISNRELIKVLEQYAKQETDDEWLYELASLYHEEGRVKDCVKTCDEIVTWFPDGEYVKKALELKFAHTALTPDQQRKYETIMAEYMDEEPAEEEPVEDEELNSEAEDFAAEFLGEEPAEDEAEELSDDVSLEDTVLIDRTELQARLQKTAEIHVEPAKEEEILETPEEFIEDIPEEVFDGDMEETKVFSASDMATIAAAVAINSKKEETAPLKKITRELPPEEEIEVEEIEEAEETAEEEVVVEELTELEEIEEAAPAAAAPAEPLKTASGASVAAAALSKMGVTTVYRSTFADQVTKPALTGRGTCTLSAIAEEEARKAALQAVTAVKAKSAVKEEADEDGQLQLDLAVISDDKEDIDGQLSIDDIYKNCSEKLEANKDKVAEIEKQRLAQILAAVSGMPATPLFEIEDEPMAVNDLETALAPDMFEEGKELDEKFIDEPDDDIHIDFSKKEAILAEQLEAEKQEEEPAYELVDEPEEELAEEPDEVVEEAPAEETIEEPAVEEPEEAAEEVIEEAAEVIEAAPQVKKVIADDFGGPVDFEFDDINALFSEDELEPEEEKPVEAVFDEPKEEPTEETAAFAGLPDEAEVIIKEFDNAEKDGVDLAAVAMLDELGDELGEELAISFDDMDGQEEVVIPEETYEEPAAGYQLTDDQRDELFEYLLVDGMEESICETIDRILAFKANGQANGGNLIVTGDAKTGKTYLAIAIVKAVAEATGDGAGKVAKVQAEALNGKNIEKVLNRIKGSDLIIENVGYLTDETIENLADAIENTNTDSMIVLEGNQLAIENIMSNFPKIRQLFCTRLDIFELSILEWANVACEYALEQGYEIDDMAKLALHARIDEINLPTVRLGYDDVRAIVDDAIDNAERKNVGKLFSAFKKKGNELKLLTEEDFL